MSGCRSATRRRFLSLCRCVALVVVRWMSLGNFVRLVLADKASAKVLALVRRPREKWAESLVSCRLTVVICRCFVLLSPVLVWMNRMRACLMICCRLVGSALWVVRIVLTWVNSVGLSWTVSRRVVSPGVHLCRTVWTVLASPVDVRPLKMVKVCLSA